MEKRIKAINSTFRMTASTVELVLAFGALAKFISVCDWSFISLLDLSKVSSGVSGLNMNSSVEEPAKFLTIVLAFMCFGSFLVLFVPRIIEKKERGMEMDNDFW